MTPLRHPVAGGLSFAADYKLRILAEYDACVGDGDKGALLRREGL